MTQNGSGAWSYAGSGTTTSNESNSASYSGSGSFAATGVVSGSGSITESGHWDTGANSTTNYGVNASMGSWTVTGGSGSGSESGSTSWSYSGSGSYTDANGSSGIAFLLPGSSSTPITVGVSGSVTGTAWASGHVNTTDQGSWTATQNASGNWTYSGSGSTTSTESNDASYSGGGSFTASGVASGGGTITESGHQNTSAGYVGNYTVNAGSGNWVLQSGSASGGDSGSTAWSYSGSASYSDSSIVGSISAFPVPFSGTPVNSGGVTGSTGTSGSITTTSQDNWTASANASGTWSYSGSGTTTAIESASLSYAGSGSFTQTMSGSGGAWLSGGGTLSESGYSNTSATYTKVFEPTGSGTWVEQSGSGSGETTWCTGWSYSGSGSYSYPSGSGTITGSTSATGGKTLDPGEPASAAEKDPRLPLAIPTPAVFKEGKKEFETQLAQTAPDSPRALLIRQQLAEMERLTPYVEKRAELDAQIEKERILRLKLYNQLRKPPIGSGSLPLLRSKIIGEEMEASYERANTLQGQLRALTTEYIQWQTALPKERQALARKYLPLAANLRGDGSVEWTNRGKDLGVQATEEGPNGRGSMLFVMGPGNRPVRLPSSQLNSPTRQELNALVAKEYLRQKRAAELPELLLDSLQLVLTAAEFIPVAGAPAGLVNGTISSMRGRPVEAALSFLSIVPLLGGTSKIAKLAKEGAAAAKAVEGAKAAEQAALLGKVDVAALEALQKGARQNLGIALEKGAIKAEQAEAALIKNGLSKAAAQAEIKAAGQALAHGLAKGGIEIAQAGVGIGVSKGLGAIAKRVENLRGAKIRATGEGSVLVNVGCFIAGTPTWITLPPLAVVADNQTTPLVDATLDSIPTTIPIEEVRLGHRVPSRNPTRDERCDISLRPDYSGWKVVRMEVRHRNGSIVDVELLRSSEWIARNGLQVGVTVDLGLTEIAVNAGGHVVSIGDGPEIPAGAGAVVTGRFVTREGSDLVRVTFADGTQLVGTASHPVWSPLDWAWRGLGEFASGQFVQARAGLVSVASVEELPDRQALYNIEVDGEHVYEVTALGVLVHNNKLCEELLKLRAEAARRALTPAETTRLARLEAEASALAKR